MRIWDYDQTTLGNDETAEQWKLERMVLYGLNGERIKEGILRKYLPVLNIPPDRRAFLELLLS